jgi:hypothetical protein
LIIILLVDGATARTLPSFPFMSEAVVISIGTRKWDAKIVEALRRCVQGQRK